MANLGVTLNVLNQKGSPALYQDLFGNIPAAGYTGRLFVSTDTNNLYRDNGSSWVQVAGSSGGSGVSSITGTANQVIASASTGAITLSLPQNINSGASPTFAGLTLLSLSTAGIVVNNGSGVLATTTGTGFVKIAAGVISYDNSTYLTTAAASGTYQPIISLTTTGASGSATFAGNVLNVPAYTLAGLGGISLTALSASSPLSYNSGTGAFAIQVANTSQAGYLTQTDWNTFNGKQAAINGTGFVKASGTTISYDNSTYITLAALSASSPLSYNSGTGAFSIQVANTSQAGYLSQSDWNTFNSKQSTITLTTTGASGAASLVSNTLNVPAYTLAGLGGITLGSLSASSPLSYNSGTGAFSIQVANASQAGYLTASDWNTFNGKQTQINGTGFVKASGTTLSYDNSTYLTTASAATTYLKLDASNDPITNTLHIAGGKYLMFNTSTSYIGCNGNTNININSDGSTTFNYQISGTSASFSSTVTATTSFNGAVGAGGGASIAMPLSGNDSSITFSTNHYGVSSGIRVTIDRDGNQVNTGNITALTGFFSTLSVAGYTYTSSTTISAGYLIVYGSGGSSGQTLTLPAASGTNQQLFFKNLSANSVTISRGGSDNLIALLTSTTSTTLTLLSGGQCGFVSDGASKWIQQF